MQQLLDGAWKSVILTKFLHYSDIYSGFITPPLRYSYRKQLEMKILKTAVRYTTEMICYSKKLFLPICLGLIICKMELIIPTWKYCSCETLSSDSGTEQVQIDMTTDLSLFWNMAKYIEEC